MRVRVIVRALLCVVARRSLHIPIIDRERQADKRDLTFSSANAVLLCCAVVAAAVAVRSVNRYAI